MLEKAFCIFCSLPLRVFRKKHISLIELVGFGLVGAIFTYLIWNQFHIAGVVLFVCLSIATELMYRLRWRASLRCKGCGFDPVVYRKDPELAASFVKQTLDTRKNDPRYMLKPQPKIKPIIRKVKDYRPHL